MSLDREIELLSTEFFHPLAGEVIFTERNKNSLRSFSWSRGVKALTYLLVSSAYDKNAYIEGGAGSLAASLDYALSKKPMWLIDMFGTDSTGRPICNRLFRRINPERKRGGVVKIMLNQAFFSHCRIEIFLDDRSANLADLKWLLELFHQDVEALIPTIDLLKLPGSELVKSFKRDGNTSELVFDTLGDLDSYFGSVHLSFLESAHGRSIVGSVAHSWWPLLAPQQERENARKFLSYANISYLYGGKSPLDLWVSSYYRRFGVQSKRIADAYFYRDLWVYDDYIFQVFLPMSCIRDVDYAFREADSLEEFDRESFITSVLYKPAEATLVISRDRILSDNLRRSVMKLFKDSVPL
ncbi:MAG: hypothetical protein D6808_05830 [Candidatus Dadabacteria bacterium]|nr:MAG: hypothetical protein D6808_05830 [Candidatus Dadabacteria bacterium]